MISKSIRTRRMLVKDAIKKLYSQDVASKPYEDIPEVKKLPIVGTALSLMKEGGPKYLHKYIGKRHDQYGTIFREKLGAEPLVFLSDPEASQEVFRKEGPHPEHFMPEPWEIYLKHTGRKRGLFFMDGKEWRENRTILNRTLLQKSFLKQHTSDIPNICSDIVNEWASSSGDFIPNVEKTLYKWSLECLGSVIFGARFGFFNSSQNDVLEDDLKEEFVSAIHGVFKTTVALGSLPPHLLYKMNTSSWVNFSQTITKALDIGSKYFKEALQNSSQDPSGSKSILSFLKHKENMSDEILERLIIDLLLAAIDTTSHSTTWLLYILGHHPKICENIRSSLTSKSNDSQNMSKESHSRYISGVLKETLRMYPVAPFIGRRIQHDTILCGYLIPKGAMVIISNYTMARNGMHFTQPDEVLPERWFRNRPSTMIHNPLAYMPWGLGSRSCIGRKLADYMMISFIEALITSYDIKCFNHVNPVLDMVMIPDQPLQLKMKPL